MLLNQTLALTMMGWYGFPGEKRCLNPSWHICQCRGQYKMFCSVDDQKIRTEISRKVPRRNSDVLPCAETTRPTKKKGDFDCKEFKKIHRKKSWISTTRTKSIKSEVFLALGPFPGVAPITEHGHTFTSKTSEGRSATFMTQVFFFCF